jgi:hypothetical protein
MTSAIGQRGDQSRTTFDPLFVTVAVTGVLAAQVSGAVVSEHADPARTAAATSESAARWDGLASSG